MICEICGMKSKAACASVVPPKATGPPPPLSSQITIVTFNVSGFQKSYSAPAGFDPMELFSEELLRDDPNVICLQEATERGDTFYDTLLPGYICLGKAASHCGLAMLFVKFGWAGHATPIHTHAPAILARIKFAGGESVVFGSCHLEPYGSGAQERLRQMKEVLRHCRADDKVLIGEDYNMRQAEDVKFEALDLLDAWKEAGSEDRSKVFVLALTASTFVGLMEWIPLTYVPTRH